MAVKKRSKKGEVVCKEFRYSVPLDKDYDRIVLKKHNTIYSDLYFKSNKSLNGVIKNLSDYNQLENNTLVCDDHFLTRNLLNEKHLAIYEVRKTVEFRAVLRDMYVQYDYDLTVPAFRAKCFEKFEKNSSSFSNYAPIIKIEKKDVYEQYFYEKKYDEVVSRISVVDSRKRKMDQFLSNEDLDRISPVKHKKQYSVLPTSERDILRLSSLSVHELEDILLKRKGSEKQKRVKIRSLEDVRFSRTYPMLEPLILKDEYDSEKVRLRIAEHKKIVRITIAYTLAFFILVIITFFIIYYA